MTRLFERYCGSFCLAIALLCVAGISQAQTQPWDTNIVSFTAPTTCTTGEPVSACPVTGYRLERSASTTGTFATLAALPATATGYTHNGVTAGQNCYRVIALSANGDSGPSNVGCKTNTKPVGPPNPPVLTVSAPTAYNVRPNLQRFVFERGTKYEGFVKTGAACDESRTTGEGFYVVARLSQVVPRPPAGTVLVAHCS